MQAGFQYGPLGDLAQGAEGGNFPFHERDFPSAGRGWGCPGEGLASSSLAFFPQAPGVSTTLSLHVLIPSPPPGRISQRVASLPGVSEEPLRDRVGIPNYKGNGHLNLLGEVLL